MMFENVPWELIIPAITGLLGISLGKYWESKREKDTELRKELIGRYRSILIFMRLVLNPEEVKQFKSDDSVICQLKTNQRIQEHAKKKLNEFYYASMLLSDDEVLTKIKEFMDNPKEKTFIETALAMRKELWGKKTKLNINVFRSKERKKEAESPIETLVNFIKQMEKKNEK